MGLPHTLVDRARRVYAREDPATAWTEGQPSGEEAVGPWFACRFRPQSRSEQEPANRGGYQYVDEQARLLIGPDYEDGTPLVDADDPSAFMDADDMVEVESELGLHRWYCTSAPEPLRRRSGVIGWRVGLRRAREATVAEEPLTGAPEEPVAPLPQAAQPAAAAPRVSEWDWEGG